MTKTIVVSFAILLPLGVVAGEGWFIEARGALGRADGSILQVTHTEIENQYPPLEPGREDGISELHATDDLGLAWDDRAFGTAELALGHWLFDRLAMSIGTSHMLTKHGAFIWPVSRYNNELSDIHIRTSTLQRGVCLTLAFYPLSRLFVEGAVSHNYLRIQTEARAIDQARVSGRRTSDYYVGWRAGAGLTFPVDSRLDAVVTASWQWAEFVTTFVQWATSDTEYSLDLSGPELSLGLRWNL